MSRVKNARDPQRRERIIRACLDTILDDGVVGTSHRKVAARADVPLGSMTYYFSGMDELLYEAFSQFVDETMAEFESMMSGVLSLEEFRTQYTAYISDVILGHEHSLVLTLELYTLAARSPEHRELTKTWLAAMKEILTHFVDEETAILLDALIEGLSLHRALGTTAPSPELIRSAFNAIVAITKDDEKIKDW